MHSLSRPLMRGLVALTLMMTALYLIRALGILPQTQPLDPNEGWNAYHTMAILHGGALYPPATSYLVNNYPPLSFYLVALVSHFTHDAIIAGRIVSTLAFFLLCGGMFVATRRLGAGRGPASFAILLFIAGMLSFTDYVAMDDPQMLAHALAMGGFLLVLRRKHITWAALLFTLAVFVKHNVFAMALASVLWLLLYEWRAAAKLVLAGIGFTAVGLYGFQVLYGLNMWDILASARSYSMAQISGALEDWLRWNILLIPAALWLFLHIRGEAHTRLILIYVLCAIIPGLYFLGGAGVDVNAMFDADIALTLGAAVFLSRIAPGMRKDLAMAALTLPVLIGGVQMAMDWHFHASDFIHPGHKEIGLAKSDIQFIRARPGPAMCQMLSLCYWAGKPPEVDMFNTGEQFNTHTRTPADLAAQIANHRFSVIQFDRGQRDSLGPVVLAALEKYYHLEHADGYGEFYIPAVLGS